MGRRRLGGGRGVGRKAREVLRRLLRGNQSYLDTQRGWRAGILREESLGSEGSGLL